MIKGVGLGRLCFTILIKDEQFQTCAKIFFSPTYVQSGKSMSETTERDLYSYTYLIKSYKSSGLYTPLFLFLYHRPFLISFLCYFLHIFLFYRD